MGVSSLGSNPNGSSTGSTGDIVYIADLKFVETTSNGFVETWYDQSGNSRDAVQATAESQPKIVNAGTLLNELSFDGTNDVLKLHHQELCLSLFHYFTSLIVPQVFLLIIN